MREEWKDIEGYEGIYQVSNYGRVKSLDRQVSNGKGLKLQPGRLLSQSYNQKGYPIVYLSKNAKQKTITVHRLVALAFVKNIDKKPQVNHIDGIKTNNKANNLEWCTNSENQLHAYRLGLNYVTGRAGKPKRAVIQIDINTGEHISEHPSIAEATKSIGFTSKSNIGSCCRGLKKTVGGYGWIYKDEREVM